MSDTPKPKVVWRSEDGAKRIVVTGSEVVAESLKSGKDAMGHEVSAWLTCPLDRLRLLETVCTSLPDLDAAPEPKADEDDPGYGYEWVKVREKILAGDQFKTRTGWDNVEPEIVGEYNYSMQLFRRKTVLSQPAPNDGPGEGYRWVEVGEIVPEGSQFKTDHGWEPTRTIGKKCAFSYQNRCPIDQPNPATKTIWRLLEEGEVIQEGDGYAPEPPSEWIVPVVPDVVGGTIGKSRSFYRRSMEVPA